MSYGLDYSEVRYETDHAGNRLKATIPYAMFSALTEFWVAARRAQTAKLEATTRPGQYKGSLQATHSPIPDEPAAPIPKHQSAHPTDRKWGALLATLPTDSIPATDLSASASPVTTPVDPASGEAAPARRYRRLFYREFVEAPPAEVMERIERGVYFIRAWREYRGLTLLDAADLFARDKTTIIWHESGKNAPSRATLEKLAQIYDCPLAQMTPKPGADTSPFAGDRKKPQAAAEPKPKAPRTITEPRSPADTDYPDAVLAHLMSGKTPMLAWRLYRSITIKDLAHAYGGREPNIKAMEQNAWLRRGTIDKLCAIYHCKPEQLLRPAGMPSMREALDELSTTIAKASEQPAAQPVAPTAPVPVPARAKRTKAASAPVVSAMEAAFLQTGTIESPRQDKDRKRDERLARMQKEMAQL